MSRSRDTPFKQALQRGAARIGDSLEHLTQPRHPVGAAPTSADGASSAASDRRAKDHRKILPHESINNGMVGEDDLLHGEAADRFVNFVQQGLLPATRRLVTAEPGISPVQLRRAECVRVLARSLLGIQVNTDFNSRAAQTVQALQTKGLHNTAADCNAILLDLCRQAWTLAGVLSELRRQPVLDYRFDPFASLDANIQEEWPGCSSSGTVTAVLVPGYVMRGRFHVRQLVLTATEVHTGSINSDPVLQDFLPGMLDLDLGTRGGG